MASDPLAAVQQLQSLVTALAPSLRPQVLPKGVEYGLDLILSLCKTEEQRQTLLALVRTNKPNAGEAPKTQQDEEDTDDEEQDGDYLEPQVVGIFDMENRVFAVQKVQWMHERDAVVHEFARFIELQLENPVAANQVVQYFLEVNGHKPEQVMLAQQCFSAAFALQTLLRAFPRLPVAVDGKVVEVTEDSDVAEVFAPLFAPKKTKKANKNKAQPAQKQEPAKKGKTKQQKSKKRKSA
ncbi:RING-box protein 1 [Phytophthora cinnamomi]|uniref:RING-box protein 1 n=1 Tax=Phytophthora cinnamomi TaxID=4785 RepID=UPI00355A08FD|nr:RING-box protein 1 [Phytophthora cinnamomi]